MWDDGLLASDQALVVIRENESGVSVWFLFYTVPVEKDKRELISTAQTLQPILQRGYFHIP